MKTAPKTYIQEKTTKQNYDGLKKDTMTVLYNNKTTACMGGRKTSGQCSGRPTKLSCLMMAHMRPKHVSKLEKRYRKSKRNFEVF